MGAGRKKQRGFPRGVRGIAALSRPSRAWKLNVDYARVTRARAHSYTQWREDVMHAWDWCLRYSVLASCGSCEVRARLSHFFVGIVGKRRRLKLAEVGLGWE